MSFSKGYSNGSPSSWRIIRSSSITYEGAEKRQIRQELEKAGRPITPATPIDFSLLRQELEEDALEERHPADIPSFNLRFGTLSTKERIIIALPLGDFLEAPGAFFGGEKILWCMRRNYWYSNQLSSDKLNSVAELVWIPPVNVNTYLGFIIEEKKAERRYYIIVDELN